MISPEYIKDKPCMLQILFIFLLLYNSIQIQFNSNFNNQKINEIVMSDPISLPFIISATSQRKIAHTLNQVSTGAASSILPGYSEDSYRLKRYELKDTHYIPEQHQLTQLQSSIIYNMQPPNSIFDVPRTITIEDYQLLQIRNIRMMLVNPTDRFKFCINEIYTDNEAIKRIQHRKLPFCLNPNNKYPFFFNLYITEHRPYLFRTSVYFLISIFQGNQLVDQKIWPRQIIAKVSQNHLKLSPLQVKNCITSGNTTKNFVTLTISNPHSHHIRLSIQSQFDSTININSNPNIQKNIQKQITIPSQKTFKQPLVSKESIIGITTRGYENSYSDMKFPKLYLPVICVKPLEINYFNIGVLNTQRSVMQVLVPVTSNVKENIQILNIQVKSSSQTIQVLPVPQENDIVLPLIQHYVVCRLLIHIPKQPVQKTIIEIKMFYFVQSSPKQILQTKNTYKFYELRNPLSLGARRFIDLRKPEDPDPIMGNIFPIRNNLNLPLILMRVTFDEKIFKLTWLKDRREHIYPNQQRDQFSLQYIGPRNINISPIKYIMMLQFNGNLIIPIQIVVYDQTLQCVYNNIQQKCQNLSPIDYGYFRNSSAKVRQITLRNWNPTPKEIKVNLRDNPVTRYGMAIMMNISKPFPNYDILFRSANNSITFYLKGNHYIYLYFTLIPEANASSGDPVVEISTQNQFIIKKIKFKVQNGTIALIPQILRISSAYQQSVQYLNLVSTFSEPYKIKSTLVNNSYISVYFNNHTSILQNQWIGLALIYNPYRPNLNGSCKSTTPTGAMQASTSTVYTQPFAKLTENCCGGQFIRDTVVGGLYRNDYRRFTHVSVRVITTTELEANATIVIDNNPPKIVSGDWFPIQFAMFKNQNTAHSTSYNNKENRFNKNNAKNVELNLMQESSRSSSSSQRQNKQYRISLKNPFKQPLKFRPILFPKALYQTPNQFIDALKSFSQSYETTMLCVNNSIAVKHNFSPHMVKSILSLDTIPQQVTIQPLENQEYYVGSQKRSTYDTSPGSQITEYVRRTVDEGARVCYKMNVTRYLRQFIESHVMNDIAEVHASDVFRGFVEREVMYINSNTFNNISSSGLLQEDGDQFYQQLNYDFGSYCKKFDYPIFKFCKQAIVYVYPDVDTVILPNQTSQIRIRVLNKYKQTSHSFYMVLLNNITKHEAHLIKINITQPKIKLKQIHMPINAKIQKTPPKNHQALLEHSLSRKDISKLLKIKQSELPQNLMQNSSIRKSLSNVLLLHILPEQIEQATQNSRNIALNYNTSSPLSTPQIRRTVTIVNNGNIDIQFTHFGFEADERLCGYAGLTIQHSLCQNGTGFIIKKGQEYNISISINVDSNSLLYLQNKNINMYLYSQDIFYFKFLILIRIANNYSVMFSFYKSFHLLLMNIISFIYIVLVIFRLKQQIDQKQKVKKLNIKTKIMNQSKYSSLGPKIQKKQRKLQPIPEDQIAAVKQIQQSRQNKFKQFFNSSDESQIAKRQQTEQQQPSNIQILSALKHDRNSMSASEESSIDFIDLNVLNRSTQNIDQDNNNTEENERENNQSQQPKQEYVENSSNQESQADSNFQHEGNEIQFPKINQNFDWGDPSHQEKKKQQESQPYYNVFFSPNPLKKNQGSGLFHWMNQYQRSHHR